MTKPAAQKTAPQYLTPLEWEILIASGEACAANGDSLVSTKQLVAMTGIPEAELRAIVQGLAAKGLIFRIPADGIVN